MSERLLSQDPVEWLSQTSIPFSNAKLNNYFRKSIIIKHCNPCLNELCEDVNDTLCLKKITKKDIEVALNRLVNM